MHTKRPLQVRNSWKLDFEKVNFSLFVLVGFSPVSIEPWLSVQSTTVHILFAYPFSSFFEVYPSLWETTRAIWYQERRRDPS